jgi:hypothetical protein
LTGGFRWVIIILRERFAVLSDVELGRGVRVSYREFGEVSMTDQARAAHDDERTIRRSTAQGLELEEVRMAVEGIRYGEVRVIIQDGVIVQIERVEKRRLR